MVPIKTPIKYEWKFTCGHVLKQDDPTAAPPGFNFTVIPMTVAEDCVYCKEFKPTEDCTKSQVELRKQDQQVLAMYESQVDRLSKDIVEAEGNDQLVDNLKKILNHWGALMAEAIKKIAMREYGKIVEPGHLSYLTTALCLKFDIALAKTKLLQKADLYLVDRARAPGYEGPLNATKLEARCLQWSEYVSKITESRNQALGVGSWEIVVAAEKDLESHWAKVVELMSIE